MEEESMQVQKINNTNNNYYKPQFKGLKFGYHTQDISSWDPKILDKFVHNKKIQYFVRIMHSEGKDILATDNQTFKDGRFVQSSLNMDILDRYTNTVEYSIKDVKPEDLDKFSVGTVISYYEMAMKKKSSFQKDIMKFVKDFNESLQKENNVELL